MDECRLDIELEEPFAWVDDQRVESQAELCMVIGKPACERMRDSRKKTMIFDRNMYIEFKNNEIWINHKKCKNFDDFCRIIGSPLVDKLLNNMTQDGVRRIKDGRTVKFGYYIIKRHYSPRDYNAEEGTDETNRTD